jgi:hypothetical protein
MTAEQYGLVPAPRDAVSVTTCWMCGIRASVGQMVADGGSACSDVRWYCLDVRSCTERWTLRRAGAAGVRYDTAGSAEDAPQVTGLPRRRPVSTGAGPGTGGGGQGWPSQD